MKLMHTKLPEFIQKMKDAVTRAQGSKYIEIRGLENLRSAKMQSLRTGRIESGVEEIAAKDNVDHVELVVMPRVPETMHTVLIKGMDKDGKCQSAIIEVINILHPTEEFELDGCTDVDDRRPKIGQH